jgi:hypothetical protein
MHWDSQEEYLRILRQVPKDQVWAMIRNDLAENAAGMWYAADLLKIMNDGNAVLSREKLCEDDDLVERVNWLTAKVLTNFPHIQAILSAASQRFEDEGT